MLSSKSNKLFNYIKENYTKLEHDGSGGSKLGHQKYELYSRDYMKYAQNNKLDDTESKINCISFLKRAIDCQTDYFLSAFGLLETSRKSNFGIDKKLSFISNIGVFDQQSLSKLNKIRNKMEHEYIIPEIEDIEVYYDLCLAYVSNIEAAMIALSLHELDMCINNDDGEVIDYFRIELHFKDETQIRYRIKDDLVVITQREYEDFTFAFRCIYLLIISDAYPQIKYFFDRIEDYYLKNTI